MKIRIWLFLMFIGVLYLGYRQIISIDSFVISIILLGISESLLNIEEKYEQDK